MFLCYLDESGTSQLSGRTSHFVLAGLAIPATAWLERDRRINALKAQFDLQHQEVHTSYLLRRYREQLAIVGFDSMSFEARRAGVRRSRADAVIAARATPDRLKLLKRQYRKTDSYGHLTYEQRGRFVRRLAEEIGSWSDARLFCVAMDKRTLPTQMDSDAVFGGSFGRLRSLFQDFLVAVEAASPGKGMGLLIEDNNETVAKKITGFMRRLHETGDTGVERGMLIETPLFVDSGLTSMVQMADLCAYAVRRFFENGEMDLFQAITPRFAGSRDPYLGLEHFTREAACNCLVCATKRRLRLPAN